jgi:hypothetical protein
MVSTRVATSLSFVMGMRCVDDARRVVERRVVDVLLVAVALLDARLGAFFVARFFAVVSCCANAMVAPNAISAAAPTRILLVDRRLISVSVCAVLDLPPRTASGRSTPALLRRPA